MRSLLANMQATQAAQCAGEVASSTSCTRRANSESATFIATPCRPAGMPKREEPPMMFYSIVGHPSVQTALMIGPSTMDRANGLPFFGVDMRL